MLVSGVLVSIAALAAPATSAQPSVVEAAVQQPSAPAHKPWPPEGVIRPGPGIVSPRVMKHPHPSYTPEAMRAGIEGAVFMEAVVRVDGTVGEVRITGSLEPGLDDQAVRTLRQWQFEPGRRDGVAIPVLIELEMWFSMRAGKPVRMAGVIPPAARPVLTVDSVALSKVEAPRLVHETKPSYTPAAMRAGIEGSVGLEIVVGTDGSVGDVRVKHSLDKDLGLDEEAIRTVRQWRFEPGRRAGVPVPVVVEVQVSFVLK